MPPVNLLFRSYEGGSREAKAALGGLLFCVRFPLHRGSVRQLPDGKVEIRHDWLSGTGEASLDSVFRLLSYSGARTTYRVEVTRLAEPPDVKAIGDRFAALETKSGGTKSLSVRDTTRATIGPATIEIDYSRPLARGRVLLGGVIPYDQVWRTGANAATHRTAADSGLRAIVDGS